MHLSGLLDLSLTTNVPVLIWGPPGVGKTAALRHWARERGLPCWTVIASLREPADFGGLPVLQAPARGGAGVAAEATAKEEPAVTLAPPRFAVEAAERGGVIFLDEITTAPPAVQAALLRAVMDRAFGDLELDPRKVAIVAAANPPEQAAAGWDLAPPLANRFLHFEYKLDPTAWVDDFPAYWGIPPALSFRQKVLPEDQWCQARTLIAAFVRSHAHLLHEIPREEARRGQAWASPRTWDYFSRGLALAGVGDQDLDRFMPFAVGCVGSGPAREFAAWRRQLQLPDPEELLAEPEQYDHPERGDLAYATLTSVVQAVANRPGEERWLAGWKVLAAAARAGAVDVAASPARTLARCRKAGWPLPVAQLRPFVPVLELAGLLPAGTGTALEHAGGEVAPNACAPRRKRARDAA